ncbi:MAG: hypothetical protein LBI54_10115 [Lachnospiraceae bacterium]|jgi:hypothetical protein|nr:hypothetical protein [Lachnospiraceae bacterium]
MEEHGNTTDNTEPPAHPQPRRDHKDVLFRYILKDKEALLTLYNALNGTCHNNAEELEITTLEDVIYLSYKNDLSFIIGHTINIYEHQTTVNPNMPLRLLFYAARLYDIYVAEHGGKEQLYRSTLFRVPCPQFVVFYSGKALQEEEKTLRLSDAYLEMPAGAKEPSLELAVRFININYGNNAGLLGKSRELEGYAIFVHKIRAYKEQGIGNAEAINRAIDDCIREGILREAFQKNRRGIMISMLYEYDQELHYQVLREQGFEQGIKQGIEQGIEQGIAIGEERSAKALAEQAAEIAALRAQLAGLRP